MNARVMTANVLPVVEEHFRFLVDDFGFTLAQTSDIPTGACYRSPRGSVIIRYDLLRDAAVDITLEEKVSGDSYLLTEILEFAVPGAERRTDVRDGEAFAAELVRMRGLLTRHCDDFLRGDVSAYRTRFREALLVKHCRSIASDEFERGDPRRAARLFGVLRGYWSESEQVRSGGVTQDSDREHHARALERVQQQVVHLRALR